MLGADKLLSEGARARGLVIEKRGSAPSAEGAGLDMYDVTVRVRFDDGSSTEIQQRLNQHKAGLHTEGDILPVRYDPADRSKVAVDVPELIARREAAASAKPRPAIADGDQALDGEPVESEPSATAT
jgi:hypothetical protein